MPSAFIQPSAFMIFNQKLQTRGGLALRASSCHGIAPGSIPGVGRKSVDPEDLFRPSEVKMTIVNHIKMPMPENWVLYDRVTKGL